MSFLSEIRKGSSSKTSRVVAQLSSEIRKLKTDTTVIEDPGLIDIGQTSKGRAILEGGKLLYTRKITTIPTFKVPFEPDGSKVVFWIKANHTGLYLKDSSKYNGGPDDFAGTGGISNTIIKVNNDRHLCLTDSDGLDLGYLGQKDGQNSVTCWDLNGETESAQVIDILTNQRCRIKDTTVGFSITAWVKISSFEQHNGTNRRIIAKSDDGNNGFALFVTATNKAAVGFKHAGNELKVETPATLTTDTWYFIAATFKSSTTKEAKIYLNGTVSTTAYTSSITYPNHTSFPGTNLQLFTNGIQRLIDPTSTDLPPPYDFDVGDWHGQIRDIRIYREKILTQQEITNFNTNKTTISNVGFGGSHIAGFIWTQSLVGTGTGGFTSGFTSGFNI